MSRGIPAPSVCGCGCAILLACSSSRSRITASGLGSRTARRGLGLVAMRERAELVGGTIEFRRPDEGGTLVRLRVPLEEAEAL